MAIEAEADQEATFVRLRRAAPVTAGGRGLLMAGALDACEVSCTKQPNT